MAVKYINIFQSKALQNWPKLVFLVRRPTIWQPWLRQAESVEELKLTSARSDFVNFISEEFETMNLPGSDFTGNEKGGWIVNEKES
jgi:hypothetical protein